MIGLGWPELILIIVILILIFGGSRIRDVAKGLGEAVREFKKASSESEKTSEKKSEKVSEDEAIIEAAKKMGIDTEGKSIKEILDEMSKKAEKEK
ncbi:MAG: twin-arginine translocase TatA/TatE family subunit [Candidatus Aenigmatarchaeota archaeon]